MVSVGRWVRLVIIPITICALIAAMALGFGHSAPALADDGATPTPSSIDAKGTTQPDMASVTNIELQTTSVKLVIGSPCARTSPTFRAYITNNGTVASGGFNIRWIADNTRFDGGHNSIPAGGTSDHDHIWSNITAGQHSLTFIADFGNYIAESNETNNRFTYTFTVASCQVFYVPYQKSEAWSMTAGATYDDGSPHYAWEYPLPGRGVAFDYAPNGVVCKPGDGSPEIPIDYNHHIKSMASGTVIKVNKAQAWLAIDHGQGNIGFYLHVGDIRVAQGAPVTNGTTLGFPSILGGYATGCHVHVAFATYTTPPAVGTFNPNAATWLDSMPTIRLRT